MYYFAIPERVWAFCQVGRVVTTLPHSVSQFVSQVKYINPLYLSCRQLVWLKRELLFGSKLAVLALGVLKPELW